MSSELSLKANEGSGRVWVHVVLLVVVAGGLFFVGSGTLALTDPDEARCALIVQEMVEGGDWVVPHLEGEAYFKKPAPFFWLAALVQKVSGNMELGGRGVAGLAGVLAVLVTYFMGRRLFGTRAGLLAGVMLATCGEFVFMARWYRMDMPFAAAMWGAVWWFWRAEARRSRGEGEQGRPFDGASLGCARDKPFDGAQDRRGWYGFYALCGLATLMKGPLGLGLPVMIVGAYLLLSGRARRVFELLHVGGMLLYVVIAAPWYAAVCVREPEYAYAFFIRQNLARYVGKTYGRHHGFAGILYVPILLVGMLPWTFVLPATCVRYFPRRWRERSRRPGIMLMWLAALVPLGFFSFSKTKLPGYILPVFAPLTVLAGGLLAEWVVRKGRDRLVGVSATAMMVGLAALLGGLTAAESWLGVLDGWFVLPVTVCLACLAGMGWCLAHDRRSAALGWAVAVIVVGYVCMVVHTAPTGYERLSTRGLARLVEVNDPEGVRIGFWNKKKLSFVLYSGVRQVDELDRHHPGDMEKLVELMGSQEKVYCLVSGARELEILKHLCPGGAYVVAEQDEHWLVSNQRPAEAPD